MPTAAPRPPVDYDRVFHDAIERLHAERRYREFIDLERLAGRYPYARCHAADGSAHDVVVWCSNDYLGMGQHPAVVTGMAVGAAHYGAGAGGTRNISGQPLRMRLWDGPCASCAAASRGGFTDICRPSG
jgi:5-aminolevulinate synthase